MRASYVRAATVAARWRVELLDLLFPPRCVSCRRPGHALCPDCIARIHPIPAPFCQYCGRPLLAADERCTCRRRRWYLDGIRAATLHEGIARQAVHAIKYDHRRDLAVPLATLLQRTLVQVPLTFDLVTAVPLHPARERERGYNQAELLARALAAQIDTPYCPGLERVRATADQIGLSVAERHANVHAAFRGDPPRFRGQRVLLIDDVCTTGATLDACAQALQAAGAQLIFGLAITRPGERVTASPSAVQEGSYHR